MNDSVLELLNRLEALLQRTAALQRADKKAVDEREALGIVQMIRAVLPAELREAHRLRGEAERLLQAAQDQARRVVLEAEATARRLADDHPVAREAARRGEDLLARAEGEAHSTRAGADAYAAQVLADLEQRVSRILEAIRKGRELLKEPPASAYNDKSGSGR